LYDFFGGQQVNAIQHGLMATPEITQMVMTRLRIAPRVSTAIGLFLFSLSSLTAQNNRTWVSGTGDDANPGSRTAPCKTLAGAIAKTESGGEINCLDAGGFGSVTITKSVTIDGGGTFASILNTQTNGIIVNGDDIVVTLRNLSIQGAGKGPNAIRFLKGAVLNIEHCGISGQTGRGIEITPGQNARVFISDTIIRGNDNSPNGGGIRIAPEAPFTVTAFLDNVQLKGNLFGLLADDRVTVTIRNTTAAGNAADGFVAAGLTGPIALNLENCVSASNGTFGIRNANACASSIIRLSNVTIVGNDTGISATGNSIILSYGNNRIAGNREDGVPTTTVELE
jgi:hypothetical protein